MVDDFGYHDPKFMAGSQQASRLADTSSKATGMLGGFPDSVKTDD